MVWLITYLFQDRGWKTNYENDSKFAYDVSKIGALAFLQPGDVQQGFDDLYGALPSTFEPSSTILKIHTSEDENQTDVQHRDIQLNYGICIEELWMTQWEQTTRPKRGIVDLTRLLTANIRLSGSSSKDCKKKKTTSIVKLSKWTLAKAHNNRMGI